MSLIPLRDVSRGGEATLWFTGIPETDYGLGTQSSVFVTSPSLRTAQDDGGDGVMDGPRPSL